ncbi:MAG: CoA-binding protein [Desulfobulbus propionicus]|nr:MAG: CoA-binding protein [Desulfobulbus propionicus]
MPSRRFTHHVADLLTTTTTIAVVGLSPKPERPSNQVAVYLLEQGYTVIPVNPGHETILGRPCYPDLYAIPVAVDIVNIFLRPERIGPVVKAAVAIKAKAVWMQLGIVDEVAAQLAEGAGLQVIMDRCLKIEHQNYLNPAK